MENTETYALAAAMAETHVSRTGRALVEARTANRLLAALAATLMDAPARRVERRGGPVREMPGVTVAVLTEPEHALATLTGRRINPWVTLAEFPWIIAGRQDIGWLGHYLPRAADFSDDGLTWRAAYGPRLRSWGGGVVGQLRGVRDQVAELLRALQTDPLTRQGVMAVWDPSLDQGTVSRDIPCTLALKAERRPEDGAVDLTTVMRSNDLVWGFSGVNVVNFTLLQRLLAEALEAPMGVYTHVAMNLHAYARHDELLRRLANGYDPTPEWRDQGPVEFGPVGGGPVSLTSFTRQCARALDALEEHRNERGREVPPSLAYWLQRLGGSEASGWLAVWTHFMALHEYRDAGTAAQWYSWLEEVAEPSWQLAAAVHLARRRPELKPALVRLAVAAAHPGAQYALLSEVDDA